VRRKERKEKVDKMAAAILLQSFWIRVRRLIARWNHFALAYNCLRWLELRGLAVQKTGTGVQEVIETRWKNC